MSDHDIDLENPPENLSLDNLSPEDLRNLKDNLSDPIWRLCTLYQIKTKKDGWKRFSPSPEQCEIINAIYIEGLSRLLILKARQLGMSTVIDLIMADMAIWNLGFTGAIVDQSQKTASKKLVTIVIGAFKSMPKLIRDSFTVKKENTEEFSLLRTTTEKVSEIVASAKARGGTNQMLHISEWGPIQHEDPPRSDEILTGAIPTAEQGIIAIETTWMGGKHGNLWQITKAAMETRPEDMTSKDFKLFFFGWYLDPSYTLEGNMKQVPPEVWKYFAECEAELAQQGNPYKFKPGQVLWYYKVAMPMGDERYREYPTTIDECFKAPVPGAVYSKLLDKIRAAGQIQAFDWSREHPVFTFWDLGSPENTRVIYIQFVGREIHFIDHDGNLGDTTTPAERFAHMVAKGYNYGGHFMPHDANAKEKGGKNWVQQMNEAGLTGIRVIPQCRSIWPGINQVGMMFNRFFIHKTKCEGLISSIEIYRTKTSNVDGHQTDLIVQDDSCHDCDPIRMLAEAIMNGMLQDYGNSIDKTHIRDSKRARQKVASSGRYRRK
jgi:hypothetical protein